jgi:hypothetical protein
MMSTLLAAASLTLVGASLALGAGARSAGAGPRTLDPNDQFVIAAVHVGCAVQQSGGLTFVICKKFTGNTESYVQTPVPGSYGIVISPSTASLLPPASHAGVSEKQPALSGPAFKLAGRKHGTRFGVKVGDRILIGGTRIMCTVRKGPAIQCAHVDSHLNVVVNSWGAAISPTKAWLSQFKNGKGDVRTVVTRTHLPQ